MKAAKTWNYVLSRTMRYQGYCFTRRTPGFLPGWVVEVDLAVLQPELITPEFLRDVISHAGKYFGCGLFRPTYGRFEVTDFKTRLGV